MNRQEATRKVDICLSTYQKSSFKSEEVYNKVRSALIYCFARPSAPTVALIKAMFKDIVSYDEERELYQFLNAHIAECLGQ